MKIKNKIKIKIKVNGKKMLFDENIMMINLVKKLKIPLNKVAIELNKKIIDKKKIKKVKLNNNDILEIVHFIGGG
jgi:thiamine biosynthesis protein ThiS